MAELFLYEVPHRNYTTIMKLSADDAEQLYGDEAKQIRPAAPAVVPPTPTQPWAVDPDAPAEGEADGGSETGAKKASPTRNKASSASSKA